MVNISKNAWTAPLSILVEIRSILNSPANAVQPSRSMAARRPVSCPFSLERARISTNTPNEISTFKNSYRANLPDTAYNVDIPSISTHRATAPATQVRRPLRRSPPASSAAMVARAVSVATTLILFEFVRHSSKNAARAPTVNQTNSFRGRTAAAGTGLRVFFDMLTFLRISAVFLYLRFPSKGSSAGSSRPAAESNSQYRKCRAGYAP